jgi:hypothetical protein
MVKDEEAVIQINVNVLQFFVIMTVRDSHVNTYLIHEQKLNAPTQAVVYHSSNLQHSYKNITTHIWFTSNELVSVLKENGLTYIGTLKKNVRKKFPELLLCRTQMK